MLLFFLSLVQARSFFAARRNTRKRRGRRGVGQRGGAMYSTRRPRIALAAAASTSIGKDEGKGM